MEILLIYSAERKRNVRNRNQSPGVYPAGSKKFEEKYGLPFTLLADTEKEVIQAYDVWKEKKNYGKVSMGVVRTTYLIDEEGIIIKAFGKVKAADNPAQMLGEL